MAISNSIIDCYNRFVGSAIDTVVRCLGFLSPLNSLIVLSVVSGLVLVVLWGKVSDQNKIKSVKQQLHARLLEAIVFRHDTGVSLRAQAALLGLSARYFWCAVPPLIILGVPVVLFMAQLNRHYGYTPLPQGAQTVVEVSVRSAESLSTLSYVAPPNGLNVVGPARVTSDRKAFFRVIPSQPATYPLTLQVGNEKPETVVVVAEPRDDGSAIERVISGSWFTSLLNPIVGRERDPSSSIDEILVRYPTQYFHLAGYRLSWELVFFGVSLAAGLVGAKLFRVQV